MITRLVLVVAFFEMSVNFCISQGDRCFLKWNYTFFFYTSFDVALDSLQKGIKTFVSENT